MKRGKKIWLLELATADNESANRARQEREFTEL